MKEIENVYKIIHDETYNDGVLFDIEINKISNTRLVVGMLVDLYSKEGYKADKKVIMQSMRNYDIESFNLQECNAYFINQMKEYRSTNKKSPSVEKLTQFVSILQSSMKEVVDGHVTLSTNKDYVDFVTDLSDDEFEYFKNILIGQELYEEIPNMIKIRG
jgi:hypothetical protein